MKKIFLPIATAALLLSGAPTKAVDQNLKRQINEIEKQAIQVLERFGIKIGPQLKRLGRQIAEKNPKFIDAIGKTNAQNILAVQKGLQNLHTHAQKVFTLASGIIPNWLKTPQQKQLEALARKKLQNAQKFINTLKRLHPALDPRKNPYLK